MFISTLEDRRFVDVNRSFCTISGCSYEQVIGHTVSEIGLDIEIDEPLEFKPSAYTGELPKNVEIKYQPWSGEERVGILSREILIFNGEKYLLSISSDFLKKRPASSRFP